MELKQQKQQLKHELRDTLVLIGMDAIRHAFRLLPEDSETSRTIENYFALIRSGDTAKIAATMQRIERTKKPRQYCLDTCLLHGAEELLYWSICEKWLSSSNITCCAFVGAWNGASCINYPVEQNAEMSYQETVLRPRIEAAFERVWNAEKELKKQVAA